MNNEIIFEIGDSVKVVNTYGNGKITQRIGIIYLVHYTDRCEKVMIMKSNLCNFAKVTTIKEGRPLPRYEGAAVIDRILYPCRIVLIEKTQKKDFYIYKHGR